MFINIIIDIFVYILFVNKTIAHILLERILIFNVNILMFIIID